MSAPPQFVPQPPGAFEECPETLPRDAAGQVDWARVFGVARPLRVEIGVGTSTFLIDVAERTPELNYVGLEYSAKRVAKFLSKLEKRGITNVRLLRADANLWISRLFSPDSVDRIYINHPDPWPKRRHEKKRFVNRKNGAILARLLRTGGGLSLRTDFAAYASQMLESLDNTAGLLNLSGPGSFALAPLDDVKTLYESKFLQAGRQIYYLEYTRVVGDGRVA